MDKIKLAGRVALIQPKSRRITAPGKIGCVDILCYGREMSCTQCELFKHTLAEEELEITHSNEAYIEVESQPDVWCLVSLTMSEIEEQGGLKCNHINCFIKGVCEECIFNPAETNGNLIELENLNWRIAE